MEAHRLGCRLDAWSEHLRLEAWREAFQATGVDPEFYLRERRLDELLPWDHVDCGVSRDFLLAERERAYQELETPDCRGSGCQDCGVCDQDRISLRLEDSLALPLAPPAAAAGPRPAGAYRYRLTYAKLEEARWLGHLEMVASFYRSLRRSGLPLSFTEGFHPLPRVSFHGALPVGVETLAETLDVELAASDRGPLVDTLNRVLPPGLKIIPPLACPSDCPPPAENRGLPGGKPGAGV